MGLFIYSPHSGSLSLTALDPAVAVLGSGCKEPLGSFLIPNALPGGGGPESLGCFLLCCVGFF